MSNSKNWKFIRIFKFYRYFSDSRSYKFLLTQGITLRVFTVESEEHISIHRWGDTVMPNYCASRNAEI